MKILVCISNVPDTTTRIKLAEGNTSVDLNGIQWVINPWDELSLTRALEIKESASSGVTNVAVAHVGPPSAEIVIRKALAIGADEAIRVNSEPSDAFFVAFQLSEVIKKENFDIVLCGIESSDYNGSLVGGMIAEFLDIPSVSAVSGISVENGHAVISRDIDGGKEILEMTSPFVAIVQKGIAREPRIAAMRGIMLARTKQIKIYEAAPEQPLTKVAVYEKPAPRAACKFIDAETPAGLIDLLRNEAKVI